MISQGLKPLFKGRGYVGAEAPTPYKSSASSKEPAGMPAVRKTEAAESPPGTTGCGASRGVARLCWWGSGRVLVAPLLTWHCW